jgi:hypothetical protein
MRFGADYRVCNQMLRRNRRPLDLGVVAVLAVATLVLVKMLLEAAKIDVHVLYHLQSK